MRPSCAGRAGDVLRVREYGHGGRCSRSRSSWCDGCAGNEAGYRDLFDLELDQLLDIGQARLFLGRDQRGGVAVLAGAAGAADAVDVVFGGVRQFVVDDVRQVVDVEAARGDVGGDQHAHRAGLEGFERFGALLLALVAVDGGRR